MKANTMKSTIRAWLSCAILVGSIGVAHAVPVVSIVPANATVTPGTATSVDVLVSGLDSEFVGAYDLNLGWDDSLLSLTNVRFDTFLDGPLDSIAGFTPAAGAANIFEISLSSLSSQVGLSQFRLFSLDFSTLSTLGTAAISLTGGILSNELGVAYPAFDVRNAEITVPAPASLGLLLIGLVGTLAVRRTRAAARPASA